MTATEWLYYKGFGAPNFLEDKMQQYAEYYHAEKTKQVGSDAEQAAEIFDKEGVCQKCFDGYIEQSTQHLYSQFQKRSNENS